MNTNALITPAFTGNESLVRRRNLTDIIEHAVASLELTEKQRQSVEATYREVGGHLASALKHAPEKGDIFPQGSYRLGTVIRPWRDITESFDLDVVFRLVLPSAGQDAKKYRDAVGIHLRERYDGIVKPLAKGWRLDFEREHDYYLDIIPAMDHPQDGIISITDDRVWLPSNPRGFAKWFERIAETMPIIAPHFLFNAAQVSSRQTSIEPLPEYTEFKLPLQRFTQVSKRHRDYYFNKKIKQPRLATASIILTTLLGKSYERCVGLRTFDSGYDVLLECVKMMPEFISRHDDHAGRSAYTLKNPSLETENLVARWNKDSALAKAFYDWHKEFVCVLEFLPADNAPQRSLLETTLGKAPVDAAFKRQVETMQLAQKAGKLHASYGLGLNTVGAGVKVPNRKVDGML